MVVVGAVDFSLHLCRMNGPGKIPGSYIEIGDSGADGGMLDEWDI